ncbi:ataxin-2-like protein isoform X1 [Xenopus laevis]|uniref:Ataxin-2-like protein isoform X1 n=1 Tax=Xenopus laevis TaxID=8355 RepID=A0A8J1LST8_XENLA|nr:ataxin-2-like protein isoform X1 [Xenopus laevis]
MLKQQQAPPSRKPAMAPAQQQGSPGSPNGNLPPGGGRSQDRPGAGRGRNIVKGLQPPVFEGVYNNSRMLHFLTAVVGSTCDVRVRNGSVYEGIFKTLSSRFELAVDAVHKKTSEQVVGPKREDIVDTMIFKSSDVAVVRFRNVDFTYATKDKFTDSAIATNSKVNGEHKDKILLRWDGGEGGNDDYDLDSDMSNGWDPNDMFKFNEDNYGVKTTYDSSLSSYTVPLEKDNTDEFRQREARATQLAREIESSPQYRARISIENDECRTEEEKHSSVQRPNSDRDSPSLANRDGKYIPLPQRVREGARGGGIRSSSSRGGRQVMSSMPVRGAPQHYPESSCSPEQRGMNGGPSRMSPKAQRPIRCSKTVSSPSSRPMEVPTSPSSTAPRAYPPLSPKSGSSLSCADSSLGTSIPDPSVAPKPSSPNSSTPIMPGEGKDIAPPAAVKEQSRTPEQLAPCQVPKQPCKVLHTDHKRNQLDELRKFGAEFRLQPSSGPDPVSESLPPRQSLECKVPEPMACEGAEPLDIQKVPELVEEMKEERSCEVAERQEDSGSPPGKAESEEKEGQAVCDQIKKSTLNPNAKEFNPSKPLLSVNKATSTPTSPGPRNHSSTATIPMLSAGQTGMYGPYISYIPNIHMSSAVQAPQMYPYPMSNSVPGQQGKYRPKGSLPQRSDQPNSAPPIMQAAAAAGPPLVAATPYSPYISYSPQQFPGQPTMMQPMAHYPSQPMFAPMLQSNPRMITSGNHPQALVSSSNPQYPPAEQPTPQTLYAAVHQSYSHHAAQLHPQPASTPTQSQQQPQHANPSPVQHQTGQPPHMSSGQPQQNLYHTATLTATPPSLTPGPSAQSPQSSYPQQAVYAIHAHQQLQHSYTNMSHVAQAHVQTGISGAHPGAPHPPHPAQVMLLHPPQSHGGPPQAAIQQTSSPSPYTYIGHHQVQSHPPQQLPFHPPGN